ncbi:uncharacterized protein [Antedon mediterranea]|uniref:uncharacterized protein n=1 Tax=Antedon mediterranea TaxID=105859 RepID=UPI003AF7CB65
MTDITEKMKHRYTASIRRLRRQYTCKSEHHTVEWQDKAVSANYLHQRELMLPNIVKIVRPRENNNEDKTYVLHKKYTNEVFIAKPVTESSNKFALPMDYKGKFHVLYDTTRAYTIAQIARILPKSVKVTAQLQNISTKANQHKFRVGTIIDVEGIASYATRTGVKPFLRCSFRGKHFFTLNMDCTGYFEIVPDPLPYTLRQIECKFPAPQRVRVIDEDSTNHEDLFCKSKNGEFILEKTSKEDFLAGNCKADNSIIVFSSKSEVMFQITNAVIQGERDDRIIARHYGNEYMTVDFTKIIGINGISFVELKKVQK